MNEDDYKIEYVGSPAKVQYVPLHIREYVRSIQPCRRHPVKTYQKYNFWECLSNWQ